MQMADEVPEGSGADGQKPSTSSKLLGISHEFIIIIIFFFFQPSQNMGLLNHQLSWEAFYYPLSTIAFSDVSLNKYK